MKLIVDVDKEDYKNGTLVNYFNCYSKQLDEIIYNGTPLEKELKKIRTKIDALPTMSCNSIGCSYMWAKDYKIDVLNILDKSIKENK